MLCLEPSVAVNYIVAQMNQHRNRNHIQQGLVTRNVQRPQNLPYKS